ncbi:MAG TPA: hypothetical protein VJQ47_18270 [Steroidobacteraceae bacterium]|nr:hypothetical protein [Steroidobacteraceae bacterium]
MSPGQRRYLLSETAISVAVNSAVSTLAFCLTFRDAGPVPVSATPGIAQSLVPQSFMVGLMGALVPILLTRARLRRGQLATFPDVAAMSLPTAVGSSFCYAIGATLVVGGPGLLLLPRLGPDAWPKAAAIVFSIAVGAALSMVITPLAVARMLFGHQPPQRALCRRRLHDAGLNRDGSA